MRDLTEQEMEVLMLTRDLANDFLELPEFHVDDRQEFVLAIHSIQNIIMSRPAMESFIAADEALSVEESTNGERD
ncbi:MAG: hypothetical protein ACYSW6_09610 [Planctomycetota bacterium]|jgi:hypothetical protein